MYQIVLARQLGPLQGIPNHIMALRIQSAATHDFTPADGSVRTAGAQTRQSGSEHYIGAVPSGRDAPPAQQPTSCQMRLVGSGGGGNIQQPLSSAAITCSGPGTPVPLQGSAALLKFAGLLIKLTCLAHENADMSSTITIKPGITHAACP